MLLLLLLLLLLLVPLPQPVDAQLALVPAVLLQRHPALLC
jgi:hypothetical protein